jgi:phage tail protein X
MATYRAKDGEMVDEICQLYYGRTQGVVERVYAANRGLAALGPRLPAGTLVVLPEIENEAVTRKRAEIWD